MPAVNTLLALGILAVTASAHFTLDYPTSRGFDDDKEPEFCGGFNSVSSARTPFPLSSGAIWIDSHHAAATVDAFLSVSENPTSFDDFNSTSNGTAIPLVTNFFQVKTAGEYCWNVDLSSLGIGLTNGSLVTVQVQYNGGDGNLYQCADLVLLSDYTLPSNLTCSTDATTNPTGTVSFAGAAATGSSGDSQASSSGASATSAGPSSSSSAAAAQSSGSAMSGKTGTGFSFIGLAAAVVGVAVM